MGFGGGGGSSSGVSAHVHNDEVGEGGSLQMVNGATATTTFDIGSGNQNIPLEAVL